MALSIDLAAKTIALSPGALLAGNGRRIGFDRGEGFERLWIGQAVHRRVLGGNLETVPGYAVEKAIRLSFAVDDYAAVLEGRLDGRWEEGGRVVVDARMSGRSALKATRGFDSPTRATKMPASERRTGGRFAIARRRCSSVAGADGAAFFFTAAADGDAKSTAAIAAEHATLPVKTRLMHEF